jgi:RimJ/RimL family protein N-acetyltransferase
MSTKVPGALRLQTARLTLVPPVMADAVDVLELLRDPRAVAHNPSDGLSTPDEAAALVARWRSQWDRYGYGYWCLRTTTDGQFIGYSGVKAITFRDEQSLNLVYRLAPHAWGLGLATEAATAVVTWAVEHIPGRPVIARVRPDNVPSQKVATKVGLRRAPALDEQGEDGLDLIFTLPAGE